MWIVNKMCRQNRLAWPRGKRLAYLAWLVTLLIPLCCNNALAGFSFSEAEEEDRREAQAEQEAIQAEIRDNLATECPKSVKNQRILLVISEQHQERYWWALYKLGSKQNQLFQHINNSFRKLGFRTYTQKQITAQVAKAELDAVASGDVDAAINAASRLAADYILRANINRRSAPNRMIRVQDVSVDMNFSIETASGQYIGSTSMHSQSFSGEDTLYMAHILVRENADTIASRLYRDLCQYASNK